ncbi:MAG TPA: hypothetical protein VFB21_19400 [Chthonomonadaceae bacterium]|nr:hypothetical protein [Chthonomonadaceae bacterium]
MHARLLLLPTVATLFLLPLLAEAQDANVTFTLSPISTQGKPLLVAQGGTLSFNGTLTGSDPDISTLVLSDSWSTPFGGSILDDTGFKTNFLNKSFGASNEGEPSSLSGKMFDLHISKTAQTDVVTNMTFTVQVNDIFNGTRDLTERFFFKVTPAAVPAPDSLMVALLGAFSGIGLRFAGKWRCRVVNRV